MTSLDPTVETRVRETFTRQTIMTLIGASLGHLAPGEAHIELPYRADLCQQNDFIHAGIITTIVDSACGIAAYTLMPPNTGVLTVEYKVNLLSPAVGERFSARGRVIKAGQTITVCSGDVFAVQSGAEKLVATMLATMIARKQT